MGGEAVPEGMNGCRFGDARLGFGVVEHSLYAGLGVPAAGLAHEQVSLGPMLHDVLVQHVEELGAEERNTVLVALAPSDQHLLPVPVDVSEFQVQQFAQPQPGGVDEHEHASVLEIGGRSEQGGHLFLAEHRGQLPLLPRPLDGLHPCDIAQYIFVVVPYRVHYLVQVAIALAGCGQVMLEGLNVLGADVVRVFLCEPEEELLHRVEVGLNGPRAVSSDLQFAPHGGQHIRLNVGQNGRWGRWPCCGRCGGRGLRSMGHPGACCRRGRRSGGCVGSGVLPQAVHVHPGPALERREDGLDMLRRVGRVPAAVGPAPSGAGVLGGGDQFGVVGEVQRDAAPGVMHQVLQLHRAIDGLFVHGGKAR